MKQFDFQYPTRMLFGKGRQQEVGRTVKEFGGKRVMVLYGGGSIRRLGLLDQVRASLKDSHIEFIEFGGVVANPRLSHVIAGIELCRKERVDFILACGGGSVIDSAKAISACWKAEGDVWNFLTNYEQPEETLPIGVILTIPGSGSESGSGCVITNEEKKQKFLYGSRAVIPKFCIINPELFLSIPPKMRWPGICDMMSHVMERYFSKSTEVRLSDRISEAILCTLIQDALRLYEGENHCEVWGELAVAGNLAHNGICDLGSEADWSCHAIEHELSGYYDVIHGEGLTVITPAWMRYVYRENIPRFVRFAVQVMGVEPSMGSPEQVAEKGIEELVKFFRKLNMPVTMSELGIRGDCLYETMAKGAVFYGTPMYDRIGSVKKLDWEDIIEIFRLAESLGPTV